ncbi:unnamed protein product, partial [Didymodactylos carnosus]
IFFYLLLCLDRTQLQTMPNKDFADLVMLPREWRRGDDILLWPKNHDYYNLQWLENLWKYINEKLPNDLSMLENTNILYVLPSTNSTVTSSTTTQQRGTITLYKLSKNIGLIQMLASPTKDDLSLQKILGKLNFHCIDAFPDIVRRHSCLHTYVPTLTCQGLLQILRYRLRHTTQLKIVQEFNTLLSDSDIKLFRQYISRISSLDLDEQNIQCIKQLPIFDNAYNETDSLKYISLTNVLYIYESGPKLPLDLQPKSCIHVTDSDSRILLDKLGYVIHDFTHVARYIITTIAAGNAQKQETTTSKISTDYVKMTTLGKWLLAHCASLILTDVLCQETLSSCKLFLNKKQELCSCSQLIDPYFKEKYLPLFDVRLLPCQELLDNDKYLSLLRHLKLRTCYDLKCDELIDICEHQKDQNKQHNRALLADFILELLIHNPKLLEDYSQAKRIVLKQYLNITPWVPVQVERPQQYPQTLTWQGSVDPRRLYVTPRDCTDKSYSYVIGSVCLISSLDIPLEHRGKIDLREIKIDLLVKHLKIVIQCFMKCTPTEHKNEYSEYSNICKKLYESLSHFDMIEISKEMKIHDINEWIWNGQTFSSPSQIYLIEKTHVLAPYVQIVPYDFYSFTKFFERVGVKFKADSSKIEDILRTQQGDDHFYKWIRDTYTDRRLLQLVNDVEMKQQQTNSTKTTKASTSKDEQTRITFSSTLDNSDDKYYLYLPGKLHSQLLLKRKKLSEEDYFIRKMSGLEYQKSLYDHYRIYNDLLLPNLNVLSKNIKDSLVLFAIDHSDTLMLNILKEHCCIPCTPNGRTLRKPSKLIHPHCKLAQLYSDIDGLFPYGGQDSYLRDDRLNVLKLLGMKCDDNFVTWQELTERCESIQRIRDYDLAYERSIALLTILNDMLTMYNNGAPSNGSINSGDTTLYDKESRQRASLQLRDISFLPVKIRPVELQHLNLQWMGDKYINRLLKPKDLLSQHYELLVGSSWPIVQHYDLSKIQKTEHILITKQIEQFLGLDDTTKIELRDVLKQLDEISKLSVIGSGTGANYNHQISSKYILDMCYNLYDYIQYYCFPHLQTQQQSLSHTNHQHLSEIEYRSSSMSSLQLEQSIRDIREHFQQRRLIYFPADLNETSSSPYLFLSLTQLLWQSPIKNSTVTPNLKPYYYQVPVTLHKQYKHFYLDLLQIKIQLEYKDLLTIMDSIKKKYQTKPLDKDDFTLLQTIYQLILDVFPQTSTSSSTTPFYLPNVDYVLHQGNTLYYYPFEQQLVSSPQDEYYVHPSVDRRICMKASVKVRKSQSSASQQQQQQQQHSTPPPASMPVSDQQQSNSSSRLFPKLFGNKKLESILARLDDPHINPQLVENMDETNPNIVLEFLLESNKYTQITNNLSDDDITIILKYFNDFLAKNYQGNFQKLRELKIYKPLWGSSSSPEPEHSSSKTHQQQQLCCSLEQFNYVYILN